MSHTGDRPSPAPYPQWSPRKRSANSFWFWQIP